MKILLTSIFFLFTFSIFGEAQPKENKLEVTWFGTTCLNISDNKDSLFFDPFINHPTLWDIISLQKYSPDQKELVKWLSKIDLKKIKGIFVSHTHFDHVLDLVGLAKLAPDAIIYGSPSTQKILKGANISDSRFTEAKWNKSLQIGSFKITILPAIHAPHFFGISIGSGPIEKALAPDAPLYKYKMGRLYNYLVEHPSGNILFHPSGHTTLTKKQLKKIKTPLVIQGIYSRESDEDLVTKIFDKVEAKDVIAVHYDNLLSPLTSEVSPMIGSHFERFTKTIKENPKYQLHQLKYGEAFKYPIVKKSAKSKIIKKK